MSSNVGTSLFEKKIQETIVGFCCVDKFKHESGVATAKQRHKTVRTTQITQCQIITTEKVDHIQHHALLFHFIPGKQF